MSDAAMPPGDEDGGGADDGAAALTPRQQEILEAVTRQGFATVEVLARRFDVSAQSVRRDIIRLDRLRLLQRFHGGAGVREASAVRLGYAQKQRDSSAAKERIGRMAAALVPEGGSVFLDVGTTVEAVARALRGRGGLRVFTCSLPAAMLLAGEAGVELFVTGGLVRGADGSLVGDHAAAAVGRFRFDVAMLGFSGFDEDGALMDFDMQKVAVKQAVMAAARRTVAVADSSKFARSAVVRLAPASAVAVLVSDALPPPPLRERLEGAGMALAVA